MLFCASAPAHQQPSAEGISAQAFPSCRLLSRGTQSIGHNLGFGLSTVQGRGRMQSRAPCLSVIAAASLQAVSSLEPTSCQAPGQSCAVRPSSSRSSYLPGNADGNLLWYRVLQAGLAAVTLQFQPQPSKADAVMASQAGFFFFPLG